MRAWFPPDLAAQADIGEDHGVCVDPVQRVHHGLHPLDPILLTHGATFPLVDLVKKVSRDYWRTTPEAAVVAAATLSAGGWW